MKINELFQPGKNFEWEFRGSEEAHAKFNVGEIPYTFVAYSNGPGSQDWEVEFKVAGKGRRTNKFGLTGTGNAANVMSAVVDIMRDFLAMYKGNVQSLSFSADEQSRQGLYARMVKRLLPDWTLSQNGTQFVLSAPEMR